MSGRTVIEGAAIATVDAHGTEHRSGHVVVEGEWIVAVGEGPAPAGLPAERRVDGTGCLVTPGFVNTHHHLYQWATRGLAQDATLYEWLTALYPIWAGLDAEITHAAAEAGLAWLARTGCTTTADHHYVFPRDPAGQVEALVTAADAVGLRLHVVRGSMDRGRSRGGLPPDSLVEDTEAALLATERAIDAHHDPAPTARVRVAVGPCSPFSASRELMERSADLARRRGVRLHTHLAETLDEERQCRAEFGRTPVEYADDLGWLAEDVWLAHGVHLSDQAVRRVGATGTGVAHCPTSNGRLGAGVARVRDLLDAGAPVGLGVDGAASNESCGLVDELREALLLARQRGGPRALAAREALWMATAGGARCLGRSAELGSVEPGKLADLAVWRLDGLAHAGIEDPVAALVLGARAPLAVLMVGGRTVVAEDEIRTVDEAGVARALRAASRRLAAAADNAAAADAEDRAGLAQVGSRSARTDTEGAR
ncbi:Cytosine/adenosine deaminase [Streptoalloteichus tenebrarius]|uniref:Cytosine/adenosine deaminase n=1 Tax=Streptoalloteichus tenebrarius (strain ATCC 17920 / DSM 40477 / JCM 4838 / CBS 697.72 / NBRC 16177 / NCIMB 11028 / NRRL B-12390 / A12253. 1 / ISP 5477) TaxID=1933 RepID=A0ABT1I1V2_STRSD|nr:8-oxoguanine deaminase [Streptoalloteichus tenebrarius]MCP2261767.1 Cytosine/adenosine deaminase [Streptoalloteichus tenebrarius]BFF00824.1 8-oxoguanine deaminase [Streptoalloteichus tenebrarius]